MTVSYTHLVYQVSFLVKASVTVAGAIGVTPQLNGVSQTGFATSANATLTAPTVSVSGTFLVNTLISADVQVSFLYTSSLDVYKRQLHDRCSYT